MFHNMRNTKNIMPFEEVPRVGLVARIRVVRICAAARHGLAIRLL